MFLIVFKPILSKKYKGLAFYPFIVMRNIIDKEDKIFINHEKIHLRQQLELFIVPFYIWYFLEFIIKMVLYRDWNKAYKNILFEKEAYTNEKNLDYLNSRIFWGFLQYF